jgi:predicted nucleic acid-binding protein
MTINGRDRDFGHHPQILRDVDDQPVLGTLLAALKTSGVDYLITGDKDLLAMAERFPIVAPAKFWATHAGP